MPIPEFIAEIRRHIGTAPLWLPAVSAVVLKDDEDRPDGPPLVLLVRRADNGAYTPITGIVDPLEMPDVCAVREAEEEASVRIEVERLVAIRVVGPVTYDNGDVSSYLDHAFRCRWVAGEPAVGDEENTEADWWPVDALPPMSPHHIETVQLALADEPEAKLVHTRRPLLLDH